MAIYSAVYVVSVKVMDLSPLHTAVLFACRGDVQNAIKTYKDNPEVGNINEQGPNKLTALHFAYLRGDDQITELLRENGCSDQSKDDYGNVPSAVSRDDPDYSSLYKACAHNQKKKVVEEIIGHADGASDSFNVLQSAVAGNDNEHVIKWIEEGADLSNKTTVFEDTSLHLAVKGGFLEVTKTIIDAARKKGILTEVLYDTNKKGFNALHIACLLGHLEIVRVLVEAAGDDGGRFINTPDNDGNTPLHYAVMISNLE